MEGLGGVKKDYRIFQRSLTNQYSFFTISIGLAAYYYMLVTFDYLLAAHYDQEVILFP